MSEAAPDQAEKPKSRFLLKLALWLAAGALVLAALGAGGLWAGHRWMQAQFAAPGPVEEAVVYDLQRGAGLIRIAADLESRGLISDRRVFRFAITLDGGQAELRAGEYAIPAGASMADIYDILRSGVSVQYPITFAEGLTSAMIVAALNEADVLSGEIGETPEEGALLPETYLVDRGASRAELLARMAEAQTELLDELWPQRQPGLPFDTREEAIILASIVEKETGVAEERPLIAAVFVNRLRRGDMRLQSDPTIIYGITRGEPLGRGIRRSEIDNPDNAWNTYQIDGLPPTPIANPGSDSLAAVLNPADSDALFFVADGTGGHVFARTLAEHNRNVAAWRRIERQRRQAQ